MTLALHRIRSLPLGPPAGSAELPGRALASIPYLHLVRTNVGVRQEGELECSLGHRLPRAGQEPPDGIFAGWRWDGETLEVRTDRYGMHPLFYYGNGREIGLSPSIPQLLQRGAPLDLDEAAIAVFLRIGFFLDDDTPFRGIRAAPPSACFDWGPSGLQVKGQPPDVGPIDLQRSQALDAFIELFRSAIARRPPPRSDFLLPLSGGRDSRHILLELCRAGHPPSACVTAWRPYGEDPQVAAELAAALDLPHVVVPPARSRLQVQLLKNVLTSFCADEHGWLLPLAQFLRRRTSSVYDGLAGGILSNASRQAKEWLPLARTGRFEELARRFWSKEKEGILERLLPREEYRRFPADIATARLAEALRVHAAAPSPLTAFLLANRTRREIALAPHALLREVGPVFCPYLDHDLHDLLAGLPAEFFLEGSFHDEAIARAFPEAASVRYGAGIRNRHSWRSRLRYTWELTRYLRAGPRPSSVRTEYVLPRIARHALDPRYRWRAGLAIWLVQLERLRLELAERAAV